MRRVRAMSTIRRLPAVGVVVAALTTIGPAWAAEPPPEPDGAATISSSPGGATINWTASCPNPSGSTYHYWYVLLNAYHQDGSHASYKSTAEINVTSDSRTDSLGLHPAPGLNSETFDVTVTLSCYPYPETLIGQGSVTVTGGGGAGGGGTGGGGGGGAGAGGGGADPSDPLRPGGCERELRGTRGPDVLNGGSGGDLILGLGGADLERGRGGDDCLVGDADRDRLLGGDGYDRLTGGRGADRLEGGGGRNAYDAGPGNDRVDARNGRRETVICGSGEDRVRADAADHLVGCEHLIRAGTP